jgi:hypothetical protein
MRRGAVLGLLSLAIWPAAAVGQAPAAPATVTTGSLYAEMVDLMGLTRLPEPAYRTVQFSSYDRRSNLAGGPGWFANSDGFGNEPIPGFEAVLRAPGGGADSIGEYLMADVDGPGAIVRLWTAAIDGNLQVFLDGQAQPLYEGPADPFFRRPLDAFAQSAGLEAELVGRTLYERDAAYVPIPFARHLRMVWIGNLSHIHFYQVDVRRYAPGTSVATFTPSDLVTYREAMHRAIETLGNPDAAFAPSAGDSGLHAISVTLQPGEAKGAVALRGPAAIVRLELKVDAPRRDLALRQTLLDVYDDGYPRPQVESPVGDFFGAAPGVNPYQSLPFTVLPDGRMISRFVMPFQTFVLVRLVNLGEQPVTITGSALVAPYQWDPGRSMHFIARWRVNHDLVADPAAVQDLPFLLAHGAGVYVGTTAILLNPSPIPTSYGDWWGEGDEKVFVDDDQQPSIFGTGSEDYFDYSWSSPDVFAFPYCGQPRNDGPGNRGFVADYRWHILDPIPFAQSVGFYMELYSHERTPGLAYARTAYHYGRPGMTDDDVAITPDDVREQRLPAWVPAARMGARNSVFHQTETLLGAVRLPFATGNLYAGGRMPVWRPARVGAALRLTVPVGHAGRYLVHFVARSDGQGGTLRVRWDGEPAALVTGDSVLDLALPARTVLRDYALPAQPLTAGRHVLEFVYAGAAPGITRPEIGIDFVWVQELK